MKKVLMFVALIATLMFAGCEKNKQPKVSFLDTLKADYETMVKEHPGLNVVFYEADCVLGGNVSERKPVSIVEFKEIYQADSLVFVLTRNLVEGTASLDSVEGFYCEDLVINLDSVCDFDVALEQLYKADMDLPESNLMTLRRPLYKVLYNTKYIFGSQLTSYVAVDGVTLEVEEFE